MAFFKLSYSVFRSFPVGLFRSNLERIPYSGKFCFVLPEKSGSLSHIQSEKKFRDLVDKNWKWGLLPSSDQRVTRLESIAGAIIAAMNAGLMLDKAYKINGNVYEPPRPKIWEQRRLIWKPVTRHLNGTEWELYAAECMPYWSYHVAPGKIIISAKLLDGENSAVGETFIATLVGFEMGNLVCKNHLRFGFMMQFYNLVLQCIAASVLLGVFGTTDFLTLLPMTVFAYIFACFLVRRIYAEAGHIGLFLMASAGYDPLVASAVYQYIFNHKDGLFGFIYSGGKLAKLWSKTEVMKQAIEIYEEAKAGKGVRKFV